MNAANAGKGTWLTWFLQINFTAAMGFMIWIAEMVSAGEPDAFSNFYWAFAAFALYSATVGFYIRRRLQRQIADLDSNQADEATKLTRLRNIFSLSSAASICFMGAFSRMLFGTSLLLSLPFYVVSFCLLTVWWPSQSPTSGAQ